MGRDQALDAPMEEKKTTRGLTFKAAWETFQETRGKTLRDSSMSIFASQC